MTEVVAPEPMAPTRARHVLAPFERALFAAPENDPHRRRVTDALLLAVASITVLVSADIAAGSQAGERTVVAGLHDAFGWLDPLWSTVYAALTILCLALIAGAIVGRRRLLIRDLVCAAGASLTLSLLLGEWIDGRWPSLHTAMLTEGDPSYPTARIGLVVALLVVSMPELTRPARRFSEILAGFGVVACLMLEVAYPSQILGGLAVGATAGALVRLVFGTPAGFPSEARVEAALRDLGVTVSELARAPTQRAGVASYVATCGNDTLEVKVYGRDARDTQLFARVWRMLWYRDAHSRLSFTRLQQVEHEALMLLFAAQHGVAVPRVVAVGTTESGDAVLVTQQPPAEMLAVDERSLADDDLAAMFEQAAVLRAASVGHGHLNAAAIFVRDGNAFVTDFQSAQLDAPDPRLNADLAELLVSTALLAGSARAIAAAETHAGRDALRDALPYVQTAALTPRLREAARHQKFDLDGFRAEIGRATGTEVPEMAQLRRVSVGRLLLTGLLVVALYILIAELADIGFDTIWDVLSGADIAWCVVALLLAQSALIADAFCMKAIVTVPLPLGPTTLLESAIKFINLTVPSSAGKVALNIRYLQKQGADAATAVTQGALDGLAGFIIQALILLLLLPGADFNFDAKGDINKEQVLKIALIVAAVGAVAIIVAACFRKLREKVTPFLRSARTSVSVLFRSPRRAIQLLTANFTSQLLYALCLGASLRAYGEHTSIANLLLINTGVTLFAGMMPVPGGIGVAEAGLMAGLTAVGIPSEIAFAAALTHRLASYYLPPIPGYFSLRWLGRHGYV